MLPSPERTFLPPGLPGPPPRASCPVCPCRYLQSPPSPLVEEVKEKAQPLSAGLRPVTGSGHGSLVVVVRYVRILEASPLLWKRPLPCSLRWTSLPSLTAGWIIRGHVPQGTVTRPGMDRRSSGANRRHLWDFRWDSEARGAPSTGAASPVKREPGAATRLLAAPRQSH